MEPKAMERINDRPPNWRTEDGRLYLVRCFACGDSLRGRENYAMSVPSGECHNCGWKATLISPAAGQGEEK